MPTSDIVRSEIDLVINGRSEHAVIDPRTSLLDLLREHLNLTGTKKGCNQGASGRRVRRLPIRIEDVLDAAVESAGRG